MKFTFISVFSIVLLLNFPQALEAILGVYQRIEYSSNEEIVDFGKVDFFKVKVTKNHIYKVNARLTLYHPVSPNKVIDN